MHGKNFRIPLLSPLAIPARDHDPSMLQSAITEMIATLSKRVRQTVSSALALSEGESSGRRSKSR